MIVVIRCTIFRDICNSLQHNQQRETTKTKYHVKDAWECSIMGKGGKTLNPLQQDFKKKKNKEHHISVFERVVINFGVGLWMSHNRKEVVKP
jgi:hypothetical protein